MCSRFVSGRLAAELAAGAGATVPEGAVLPERSWNVAPTDTVSVVVDRLVEGELRRELHPARWGLITPWATDAPAGAPLVNARIETVAGKPSFADAVRKRRCVVLADGYYEWRREAGRKQPYYIHPNDGGLMLFAGLYGWWKDPRLDKNSSQRWLLTACILTHSPIAALADLHDRAPVSLDRGALDEWLQPHPGEDVAGLLAHVQEVAGRVAASWSWSPVSAAVGAVSNNGPALIAPLAA